MPPKPTANTVLPEEPPPGRYPEPPADLHQRLLPIVSTQTQWFRIHQSRYAPLFFGRTGLYRFDAPANEYGVLYAANDEHGAFVETFDHSLDIRVIDTDDLKRRTLLVLTATRPLNLVDLTGTGLARLGADNCLCTGDYRLAQHWSGALWHHPESPDGVYYRFRLDLGRRCVALFDRAQAAITAASLGSLSDARHKDLLATLVDRYAIALL